MLGIGWNSSAAGRASSTSGQHLFAIGRNRGRFLHPSRLERLLACRRGGELGGLCAALTYPSRGFAPLLRDRHRGDVDDRAAHRANGSSSTQPGALHHGGRRRQLRARNDHEEFPAAARAGSTTVDPALRGHAARRTARRALEARFYFRACATTRTRGGSHRHRQPLYKVIAGASWAIFAAGGTLTGWALAVFRIRCSSDWNILP